MSKNLIRLLIDRYIKVLYFIIYFLLISILFATGQSLIEVKAEVDKSVITIGDRIRYTLTIKHHENVKIEKPGPGANLGQFEIKDYQIFDPVEKNGLITQNFEYEISVFDTGKFMIPPFPVAFNQSDTSKKYELIQSEPIEIFVKSVLTAEDSEIRDIKPPQSIPFNYRKWIIWGIAGLLVVAAVGILFYIIRKRKEGVPLFKKEVIRPAHEIAFEEIDKLKKQWRELFDSAKFKTLFAGISQILRKYLENRFFISALEETTPEILDSLQDVDINEHLRNMANNILQLSDLVKFAKYIPVDDEVIDTFNLLEQFINETKLIFEAVEQEIPVTVSAEENPDRNGELNQDENTLSKKNE